jgi:hypothetical protein
MYFRLCKSREIVGLLEMLLLFPLVAGLAGLAAAGPRLPRIVEEARVARQIAPAYVSHTIDQPVRPILFVVMAGRRKKERS